MENDFSTNSFLTATQDVNNWVEIDVGLSQENGRSSFAKEVQIQVYLNSIIHWSNYTKGTGYWCCQRFALYFISIQQGRSIPHTASRGDRVEFTPVSTRWVATLELEIELWSSKLVETGSKPPRVRMSEVVDSPYYKIFSYFLCICRDKGGWYIIVKFSSSFSDAAAALTRRTGTNQLILASIMIFMNLMRFIMSPQKSHRRRVNKLPGHKYCLLH